MLSTYCVPGTLFELESEKNRNVICLPRAWASVRGRDTRMNPRVVQVKVGGAGRANNAGPCRRVRIWERCFEEKKL